MHAAPPASGQAELDERTYLFVGERPSPLAATRHWTWDDGHVCARTLLAALADSGIRREACRFVNLWSSPGLGPTDEPPDLAPVIAAGRAGVVVVALGRLVQRELVRSGVAHRALIHPAARGAIRRRDAYRAHVRNILGQPDQIQAPADRTERAASSSRDETPDAGPDRVRRDRADQQETEHDGTSIRAETSAIQRDTGALDRF